MRLRWSTESWTGENLVLTEGTRKVGVLRTSALSTSKIQFHGEEIDLKFRSTGIWKTRLEVFHQHELLGVLEIGSSGGRFTTVNKVRFDWKTNFWGGSPAWVNARGVKQVLFKSETVWSSSSGSILIRDEVPSVLGVALAVAGLLCQRQLMAGLLAGLG